MIPLSAHRFPTLTQPDSLFFLGKLNLLGSIIEPEHCFHKLSLEVITREEPGSTGGAGPASWLQLGLWGPSAQGGPCTTCHGAQRLTWYGPVGRLHLLRGHPLQSSTGALHARSAPVCRREEAEHPAAPLSWHHVRLDTLRGTIPRKGSEVGGVNVEGSTQAALCTMFPSSGICSSSSSRNAPTPTPTPTLVPPHRAHSLPRGFSHLSGPGPVACSGAEPQRQAPEGRRRVCAD